MGRKFLRIMKYFKYRQEEDGSYYCAMDLGDDSTLHSVLWIEGRARFAYLQLYNFLLFNVS